MEKNINVNEFIFGRTKAEKKLQVLDAMSDNDIRKASDATILRIYKECRGKDSDGKPNDRFWINCDRRAGNNWNSTIEFIYEYKGRAMVCLYVQNSSTDTSTCDSYANFNYGSRYNGSCSLGSFTYDADEIAGVIRCILKEFVYYKYIERAEREHKEKIAALLHWKIANPVYNKFYDLWRCKYESGGWRDTPNTDRYHRAKKAVENYATEHVDELTGMSAEELQKIYSDIFRNTD